MNTRRAARVLAAGCLVIAALAGANHAQARKDGDDARSARQFVQRFYDWYASFERTMFEPGAVKASRLDSLNAKEAKAALAPRLLRALAEDYSAQGRVSGYIVGLDFDPFLATNGPTCDRYEAASVERKSQRYWVGIRGAGSCAEGASPIVFVEVAQEDGRWQVVNFHYPGESATDLVSLLERLRNDRKKPAGSSQQVLPAQPGSWTTIESIEWRDAGTTRTAIVEEQQPVGAARLRIVTAGQPDFTVSVEQGLVPLRDSLLVPELQALNSISASYVFLPRNLKTIDGRSVLIVTGWAFASDPGSFRAMALDARGRPYELFTSDTFDLIALADLDGDGLTDYSLDLSRRYNLAHYYGWVGPEASEDWTVVLCAPVRPRIMKRADAERMYGR